MSTKITTFLLITICVCSTAFSQSKPTGEYYLKGVMEAASGFKLNDDSTFTFFYSYGALDRRGSGKWHIKNDSIIFNSRPYPGKDFKLVDQKQSANNGSTLKLEGANSSAYQLVYCLLQSSGKDTLIRFDADGLAQLPFKADSAVLLSELCVERVSSFNLKPVATDYTFHFEPWITEVFFKDYALHFTNDYLEGRHLLLDDKIYKFTR